MTVRRSFEGRVFWVLVYYLVFAAVFLVSVRAFFTMIGAAYHLANLTALEWVITALFTATLLLFIVLLAVRALYPTNEVSVSLRPRGEENLRQAILERDARIEHLQQHAHGGCNWPCADCDVCCTGQYKYPSDQKGT